jgi:integrase/recombinase XerD
MTELRQRMIQDLRIRNYSPRTIRTYIYCVAKFAKHFGRSPEHLGPKQIREYQRHMVETKKTSWTTFNQTVCALRFLYRVTLGRSNMVEHIPFPRQEKRLPVVLSIEEVFRVLNEISNLKHRTVLMVMYATGLRLSEALALTIDDIDDQRALIRVEQGKGKKDRYVDLTPTLHQALRDYYAACRPKSLLFPGKIPGKPMHPTAIQKATHIARLKANISKPVKTHTMRHCFATHLLESGTNLRTIQVALGHASLSTTAVYLHIASRAKQTRMVPVDLLARSHGLN